MASWWYLTAGEPTGPATDEQVRAMALSGALSPTSKVYRDGAEDWTDLQLHEAELALPRNGWGSYFVTPPSGGGEPARGGIETRPAGPWPRYKAAFIDNMVLSLLSTMMMFLIIPLGGRVSGVALLAITFGAYAALVLAYEILSIAVRGQTPGKLAAHLEVAVVGTMEVPDLWRSLLRTLVKAITGFLFPLWWASLIMILVTPRRTGIHDLVAGTVVQEAPY